MSIKTIKLPIQITEYDEIKTIIQNYNHVLRFTYNRYQENSKYSTKEITALQHTMNNVFIDSHFLNSARYIAKSMKTPKTVFGGKLLFLARCNNKISKEEFELKRLVPLCSIGEANKYANRKFKIIDESHIEFKFNKNQHYLITLPKLRKNYKRELMKLQQLQNECKIAITYKLSLTHIFISFEDTILHYEDYYKVNNRVFAIDLNPNYVGWSVVDWQDSDNYTIIDAGVISNKILIDKDNSLHKTSNSKEKLKLNNKLLYENIDSAIWLINKAKHYKCQIFSIEQLNMPTSNKGFGKRFNKLVNNQWSRRIFYNQLKKRCDIYNIKFIEVLPNYSSFIGNLVYRNTNLPDMCLASIEIGRRGFEFYYQYIVKDKPINKNIIFNESQTTINCISQSLEELNCTVKFDNLKELYIQLKTLKVKYRVPLNIETVCSKKSIKSNILLYLT